MGGYSAGRCGWDDSPPAGDGSDNIPTVGGASEPASKWPELKAKFFNFLIDHHSEWKSIRNNNPLGYLQYMEVQFERVTGYKLVGLGACTEWIRAGTYYHWVIAQRGQLGRCPRLAGIPPPEGPMMPPPYPPVTAAPPAMAVASTQATVPNPPQGGGGRPRAKSQPRKRDAAAAGVQGAARDMGGAGDSSGRSGRAMSREPRTARSIVHGSPLLAPRLQHTGKHFPLSLLTPYL